MSETQKEKIARLEKELADAKNIANSNYEKLLILQSTADKEFEASPAFQQLINENENLRQHNKILENRLANAAKKSDEQIQLIRKLQQQIEESSDHNKRGAGRKPKFTSKQIEKIAEMRASGRTFKSIAEEMNCSVGLVHKLINEQNKSDRL